MKKVELIFTELELHEIQEFQKKRHLIEIEKIVMKAIEEKQERKRKFEEDQKE